MTARMRVSGLGAAASVLSLMLTSVVLAQSAPEGVKTVTLKGNPAFVDARGTALYTFDRDPSGKSACNGHCAAIWPPLKASAGAHDMGPWTLITRADGTRQWAYMGKPVYLFARDRKPGDARGDGFGPNGTHVWHVVRP
jgi:predicted lipoprotein with Yx(FWY)xxD motif